MKVVGDYDDDDDCLFGRYEPDYVGAYGSRSRSQVYYKPLQDVKVVFGGLVE